MATADEAERLVRRKANETKRKAESGSGWYGGAARAGLTAKGVSYGLVGVLAFVVAIGHGGNATSRSGALASVADEPWGKLMLVLLALGFAAHATWRFVQAAVAEREDDGHKAERLAKTWGTRAGCVGSGLVYAGLTYVTIRLLAGAGEEPQNERARETTAAIFDWPAGRWLVALAGLAILGFGVGNLYFGVTQRFENEWRGGMSRSERTWGSPIGMIGHVARGAVFALIGIFVTKAALDYDAQEAIGFDGALQKLASASYGPWLLGVTAAGLIGYGVFCLVDARHRDVSARS